MFWTDKGKWNLSHLKTYFLALERSYTVKNVGKPKREAEFNRHQMESTDDTI